MGDVGADGVAAGPQGNWDLHVEKRFLLIRDTPSEEIYVLNMFRMRGSRL